MEEMRAMRRSERAMSSEDVEMILETGEYGILTIVLSNEFPYGVPVNYIYHENAIYIHCAPQGQKIDAIGSGTKASFTIVNRSKVISEKFTSSFESVVAFGTAEVIAPNPSGRAILEGFIRKYAPKDLEAGYRYADNSHMKTALIKFSIEHITGKCNNKGW
jgi:hypothetical protein